MYSIVLMMALTSGADTPACHNCGGCSGGCYGGGYAGCSGGGWGCHGGGLFHKHGCHGEVACSGGCHGGLFGGHGGLFHRHGCHGGCYGEVVCGGCYAAPACSGCTGGPAAMPGTPPPPVEKLPVKPVEKKTTFATPAPATVVVNLPAEARLLIDGSITKSTSSVRVFASPTLEPGKQFIYTLRGELVRDGKTLTTIKEVTVRAGQEVHVDLNFSAVTLARN